MLGPEDAESYSTVNHLIFAGPYLREAITIDVFTRLYFRDLPYPLLLSLHKELLARTLFSRLYDLWNLRENKVLANKKCFTVITFSPTFTELSIQFTLNDQPVIHKGMDEKLHDLFRA